MLTTIRLRRCRQLTIIEVLLVGGAEIYRNTEQNIERRQYPGGVFDPLGLASGSDERAFNLKTAELKHGRLAMIAFLGAHTAALPGCLLCQTHLQHCCMPPLFTIKSTDSRSCCRGTGFGVQAFVQGEGALGSLAKFSGSFDPIESVVEVGACMLDTWQPALLAWSCRRGLTAKVNSAP